MNITEVDIVCLVFLSMLFVGALLAEKKYPKTHKIILYFAFFVSVAASTDNLHLYTIVSIVLAFALLINKIIYIPGKCNAVPLVAVLSGFLCFFSIEIMVVWWIVITLFYVTPRKFFIISSENKTNKTEEEWVSGDDENLLEKLSAAYTAQTNSAKTRNTNTPNQDSRYIDKYGYYDYSRKVIRLSENEEQWEFQIRSGNLPVYKSLKEDNQSDFFISMKVSGRNGQFVDLKSQRFGDATDALAFARSLRYNLACPCVVRKSETGNGYIVIASSADSYLLEKNESAVKNTYEFRNPFYNVYESTGTDALEEEDELDDTESTKQYTNGLEYEQYIAMRMRSEGFKNVEVTPASGDFGADIIFEREGVKFCAQCKLYSKPVGISAVQEVIGAKAHYKCAAAMVITNSTYTDAAQQLAKENAVILVDNFT